MSKSVLPINPLERGPMSESDMTPIRNDPHALFASDENIMNFNHFYLKGKADFTAQYKIKLLFQIESLQKQPETQYRNAYIDGLKRAINLID